MTGGVHFIIYALPRTRTYWLSQFLSYGNVKCGHDELRHIRGLDDIKSLLSMPDYGSAETGAAPYWRLIHAMRRDIKVVTIRRPVSDVVDSLMAMGVSLRRRDLHARMQYLDAKLDQIEARVPDVMRVDFNALQDEAQCAALFTHCTGLPHDEAWYRHVAPLRLTVDLSAYLRYFEGHLPQLQRVGRLAKQRMLQKLHHRPVASEAMMFQQEPIDVCIRDAQRLMAEHAIEVGEPEDSWTTKNVELLRSLERAGALYVTTARSNGRMFGYLMSIIAPRLDAATGRDGVHTLFYASPDAPGLGLKLQRASVEFLRSLGVDQVAFRAGTRGSGDRSAALYRRLGARDAGQMFVLDLQEAI